jgi:hypothetical protein
VAPALNSSVNFRRLPCRPGRSSRLVSILDTVSASQKVSTGADQAQAGKRRACGRDGTGLAFGLACGADRSGRVWRAGGPLSRIAWRPGVDAVKPVDEVICGRSAAWIPSPFLRHYPRDLAGQRGLQRDPARLQVRERAAERRRQMGFQTPLSGFWTDFARASDSGQNLDSRQRDRGVRDPLLTRLHTRHPHRPGARGVRARDRAREPRMGALGSARRCASRLPCSC